MAKKMSNYSSTTKRHVSRFPGVYSRQAERINGEPDVCFDITYKKNGKKIWEKIGWQSQGYSADLARQIRNNRIFAIQHGEELPKEKKQAPRLKDAWSHYEKWVKANKARNGYDDINLYENHIRERFADKRLDDISSFDLERMKAKMLTSGYAPATVKHVLVLIRQIYNKAAVWKPVLYQGPNPVKAVKKPTVQNQKTRFLSHEEANKLLKALKAINTPTLHDISLLSLHTGMRAGEIFNLKGYDLDFENGIIRITDPKNKTTRHAYMTSGVKAMLEGRKPEAPEGLVFPDRKGKKIQAISQRFRLIIKKLGFNEGVSDRRQMITFHSLRHTFASWLALQGESIITLKEMLGHKSTAMTERYSHLIPDHKRRAAAKLETLFNGKKKIVEIER